MVKLTPEQRGKALLYSWLTPAQRRQLVSGYFDVSGCDSGARYRIHTYGVSGNVRQLDASGAEVAGYCCYPYDMYTLPSHDVWLAQALAITADEKAFLRMAVKIHMAPRYGATHRRWFLLRL